MRALPLVLILLTAAQAQTVVRGRVTDASTGDGLPAATVQAVGTSRGTITNREGDFELEVPGAADTLVVRFVGYEPARRPAPQDGRLDVALAPGVAVLDEAIVTAGNPAEAIMRRVIERKARWRAGLRSWQAEVYSRQTMRADGEVVAVIETQTDAVWDRDRGLREVVRGTRRTGNLGGVPLDAFGAADGILNLYDDGVDFGGFDLMGPTHPRALSFYRFSLDGSRALGTDLVYDLSFAPKNTLQPGWTGTLSVLSDADALLAVSVRPSDAVQFPLVDQFALTVEQQFATFGQSAGGEAVWFPVDFRMDGRGRAGNALLRFPGLGFAIASRLTDYAVNVALPDSLFDGDGVWVDSAAVAAGLPEAGMVPLSDEEERALAEIDSTESLAEAFEPTGPLARFVRISVGDSSESGQGRGAPGGRSFAVGWLAPEVWYNRVEGAHLGNEIEVRAGRWRASASAAYLTAREGVAWSVGTRLGFGRGVWAGAGVDDGVVRIGRSFYASRALNSLAALADGQDYYDYAKAVGGDVWAGWWGRGGLRPSVLGRVTYADYDPVPVGATFSLSGSLPDVNARPPVAGGDLVRADVRFRIGDQANGLTSSLTGHAGAEVTVEAGRQWVGFFPNGTARDYLRLGAEARLALPTVLRRRLLPPTLHLRLAVGTAAGTLPVVRAFGIDGALGHIAPFGALRARGGRLSLVREFALVAWEHDFRSVPFEALGWRGAASRGVSFQVHGAHAWGTGMPGATRVEPHVVHHEVGASVGLGYTLPIRLDVTYRLTDGPGVVVGVGLARLF